MNIDVVWLNLNPIEESIGRGYWDQGMIEGLFSGKIWRTTGNLSFTHHEGALPRATAGAVVVIPARHHATPAHLEQINLYLNTLDWCLVILTGDEENDFDYQKLEHPRMIVWIMTPYAGREHGPLVRFIPNGWPPVAPQMIADRGNEAALRLKDWFFSGQITHVRRENCAKELKLLLEAGSNGDLVETKGFTQGLAPSEYYERMAAAKIAPCPSGPVTPDSFRIYEALEAGCLPIADGRPPSGKYPNGFWQYLFGMDELPFPIIQDWNELPRVLESALADWPRNANRAFAWWQGYKRKLAYDLQDDIMKLTAQEPTPFAVQDGVTVLIPTSPILSHPSTEIIEKTIKSIRDQDALGDCEIIIMIDGVRPEQEARRADYEEYIRRLLWLANHEWHNVLPLVFDEHQHQAGLTRAALKLVKTPQILFVEHDTPIVDYIYWHGLVSAIATGAANVIRLHHESRILDDHKHLMLDKEVQNVGGFLGMRTVQWSQRPHLASTDWYRRMIAENFGLKSRTMIEDVLHGVVLNAWYQEGILGWEKFKLWIYTPEGASIQRSTNLDGRGSESKYGMIFAKPELNEEIE